MYDIIIVGAGPAGITAAIYAARKKLSVLVVSQNVGGQAAWSGEIENYTGFQFITGMELSKKFKDHLTQFNNVILKEGVKATGIEKKNDFFLLKTKTNDYEGKTIILAMGREPRELNVKGEKEYKNKGVTYCATCDGPLFSNKEVAIIGGGNSALDSALQMINIAKKIYLITENDKMIGEEVMIEKINSNEKIEVITNAKTKEIRGEFFVNSVMIEKEGKERELLVQGVFVEIGSNPVKVPASNLLNSNQWGEIIVNDRCETNISGMFAAGDVTNVPYKQIIVAAGHGCVASLSAFDYLSKSK